MKCPNCGHWNRASFPRCFACGTPLSQTPDAPSPAQETKAGEGPAKVYIQINEEGRATAAVDARDKLADEMKDLLARKQRGEEEQRRLRRSGAQQGLAPSGRTVQTLTGRTPFPLPQSTSYYTDDGDVEGDVRPDAIPVVSQRTIEYDEYGDSPYAPTSSRGWKGKRGRVKMRRHFGLRRFGAILAILILIGGAGYAAYQWVYKPLSRDRQAPPLQERAIISASILNDMPAHLIQIPGEEGQVIRIAELKNTFPVVGGYATIEVADFTWYESMESVTQETVTATLTPYLVTSAGEQKRLEAITYDVEIPLSPLTLVSPSSIYTEISTASYEIQFDVAKNSTVTINGEDFSDLVNNQNGRITNNVSVSPIGANEFTIVARAPYYRENSMTITLYREPQQIRLDLAQDIATRFSPNLVPDTTQPADAKGNYPMIEPNMTVKGQTVTWANIRVLSPYANLDTTRLAENGEFSFEAIFETIGNNTIIIEASAPGYQTSVVRHNVYYVPIASIYTRKAWDMNTQYSDFLNNSERRIANTQIYICKGTITEIVSEKPVLAIMKLDSNYDRTVLLQNYSNDDWKVGSRYRIFADAYGVYNGAPWLNGRYTYPAD